MVTQLVMKFPTSYRTQRFSAIFTTTHQWSLSWDR